MQRKDREITNREEIDQILNEALVFRVAFARDNEPYLVPLFYGYDGRRLYFHTARQGRKLEFLAANNRVCFEVEGPFEIVARDRACNWSAYFQSVIGCGRVTEMQSIEEKQYAINQIMRHYSGREWQLEASDFETTRVWCIDIESLSGKRSRPKVFP
jgi:nitroimidazol reductase NimA-like FMN-containing flavoprotein (pyridoxamine 5'-phosphate oxidase superfamily)